MFQDEVEPPGAVDGICRGLIRQHRNRILLEPGCRSSFSTETDGDPRVELVDDPFEDVEQMAEQPAIRTPRRVDLDSAAPTLGDAYGVAQLEHDRERELLTLSDLPHGHRWGRHLDNILGGIRPGYFLAFGAENAGSGKTAFVMQVADGLALLNAQTVSAGMIASISCCSLAALAGADASGQLAPSPA